MQLVEAGHRVVAGSVVHDQDLVALPERLEIHGELLEKGLEILRLVVDGHEHGEVHRTGPRLERRPLHHVFRCHSHWRKSPRSIEVRGRNPRSRRASFVSADVSRGSPCCGSTWRRSSFRPTSRSISSSTSRSTTRCPPPTLYANSGTGRVRLDVQQRLASADRLQEEAPISVVPGHERDAGGGLRRLGGPFLKVRERRQRGLQDLVIGEHRNLSVLRRRLHEVGHVHSGRRVVAAPPGAAARAGLSRRDAGAAARRAGRRRIEQPARDVDVADIERRRRGGGVRCADTDEQPILPELAQHRRADARAGCAARPAAARTAAARRAARPAAARAAAAARRAT